MLYHPFLPEVASGTIDPRAVVVPLRRAVRHCDVVIGEVERVDHGERSAHVRLADGRETVMGYDAVVLAPGSWARVLPIPGLAERRRRVQDRAGGDLAAQPRAVAARRRRRHRRPRTTPGRAHVRVRRGRVRGGGGARRARGPGPRRDAELPEPPTRTDAVDPGRGGRLDPARDRFRPGRLRDRTSARTPDRGPAEHEARVGGGRRAPPVRRPGVPGRDARVDRRREAVTARGASPGSRSTTRVGSGPMPTSGSRASRTPGRPATRPRCPISSWAA